MSEHFIRPDNDQEPSSADYSVLADQYQAGLDKMIASGYEEFGPLPQRDHRMVITALRVYAEQRTPLGIVHDETHTRLQSMADDLQISLKLLIEIADRNGLEIISQRGRETDKPMRHC